MHALTAHTVYREQRHVYYAPERRRASKEARRSGGGSDGDGGGGGKAEERVAPRYPGEGHPRRSRPPTSRSPRGITHADVTAPRV